MSSSSGSGGGLPGFGSASKCNGDVSNNVWVEGRDPENNVMGICLLDTMTEPQVVYVLQRDPKARDDLKRVTTDERLLELANIVPSLGKVEPDAQLQAELNRHADSIPFYTQFRGKIGDQ